MCVCVCVRACVIVCVGVGGSTAAVSESALSLLTETEACWVVKAS